MVMISKETMRDYQKRSDSLFESFSENLMKAKDLVVKDSPVDFTLHEFVCSSYHSYMKSQLLTLQFPLYFIVIKHSGSEVDEIQSSRLIESFHSLEKRLASQNDELQRFTEKISDNL